MYIEYKRLTEKELDTFIEMRINQLREEGAKDWIAVQHVYRSGVSKKGDCKRTAIPCCKGCQRIWMLLLIKKNYAMLKNNIGTYSTLRGQY